MQAEEDGGEEKRKKRNLTVGLCPLPEGKRRESPEMEGLSVSDFVSEEALSLFPWPYDLHCKWSRSVDGAPEDGAVEWGPAPICMLQGKRPRFLCVFSRQPSPPHPTVTGK